MPSLWEDFTNAGYIAALTSSIFNGLKVLVVVGGVGAALTFLTGGTQPKHWPKGEHH